MKIWEESYFIDNYLPYMLRSKLKMLMEGKNQQALLTFIENSCTDEEKKAYIEEHFVEELTLLYITQNNIDAARDYSSLCLRNFLKDWKNLSSMAVLVRQSKLQNLQKYVEIGEFLNLMKKDNLNNFKIIAKAVQTWQKRSPSLMDPINIWDDVTCNRKLFVQELERRYNSADGAKSLSSSFSASLSESQPMDVDEANMSIYFVEQSIRFQLSYAEYCTHQNSVSVALKNLKRLMNDVKKVDATYWKKFIGVYCLAHYHKAKKKHGEERIDILLNSLSQLGKIELEHGLDTTQTILKSEALELMYTLLNQDMSFSELKSASKEKILKLVEGTSEREVPTSLHIKSYNYLTEAVTMAESHESEVKSHALMSLANFCNEYLRRIEGEEEMSIDIKKHCKCYPKVLVELLLSALRQGSVQAMQLFPRLLQVIEVYPSVLPDFIKNSSGIPAWMFLGWVNQMVAILDKPHASAIHGIVQNIVRQYPNAIIYSFNLSCESYNFPQTSDGAKNKAFVQKMKAVLDKDHLITDFMAALNHLSVPHVLFKDYYSNLMTLLPSRVQKKDEIIATFKEMWQELFATSKQSRVGLLQKKFSEMFSKDILEICGKDGHRLLSANFAILKDELDKFYARIKSANSGLTNRQLKNCSLDSLSHWLSEFQPWKYDSEIEIPGQYTGKSKPMPEYHVKIAGFDDKVLILSSITQPRRITIRGNDEKEYKVLVKCGEDLRQDNRIQQLFSVMNDIYAKDAECGRRHLKLATYRVTPLCSKLGLIEWIDNTVVLNDLIINSLTSEESTKFNSKKYSNCCQESIARWVGNISSAVKLYRTMHEKKGKDESVKKFEETVNIVPHGLLKRALLKLSSSPEAFVRLRTQFAASHAVICISQWLLGIGDRHLGNFLIDMTSGREIGIDFGHAFGSATQFLAIPELVPMRLTPQYLQLMEPLKEKGTIESTMIHALSALRKNHSLLLNIMDIFIKEPTVDWKANARKQQQKLGLTDEEVGQGESWYPTQRVQIAMKKLQGVNPALIMKTELELGHGRDQLYEKYEAVCLGDPEHNIRAKLHRDQSHKLTVEEQVSCLIDHATDPHVLCKTYYGWNPWL